MKCISVYTDSFAEFSDIYELIRQTELNEDEEKEIEGILVTESGSVPEHYLHRMKSRPDVVVMKDQGVTILKRGQVFEILMPELETVTIS